MTQPTPGFPDIEPASTLIGRRGLMGGMLVAFAVLVLGAVVGLFVFRARILAHQARINQVAAKYHLSVDWTSSELQVRLQLRFPKWKIPDFIEECLLDVRSISVSELDADLPPQFFTDLQACHNLHDLHWLDNRHTAQVVELIRRQRKLVALEWVSKGLRDADLDHPALFEHLTDLSIDALESEQLTGRFLTAAGSHASQLKALQLCHVNLSAEACLAMGRLNRLEYLDLTGCNLTAESARFLTGLTHLKGLVLDHSSVNNEFGPTLGKLSWLEHLSIKDTAISETGMCELAGCTSLKHLDTGGKRGRAGLLACLRKCHRLRSADVVWTGEFSAADVAGFKDLPDLTYLYFATIGDAEAGHLTQCPHLTGLDIQSRNLTLKGVSSLMQLPELGYLKLSGKEWEPELVDVLDESTTLENVKIHDSSWEWAEFEDLREKLRERAKKQL